MAYHIIPYGREHQQQVNALIISIQAQEFSIPIILEEQTDLFDVNGFYRQGRGDFWVALHEGHVVGTVALRDLGHNQGALRKMFVHAEHRGTEKGVARLLLESLLSESRQRGFQEIFLGTTDAFRAAHRFYEKSGFAEISPKELPNAFPRMVQDTKYYRMKL
jgi:N-acetylglutamate synthase-like GNAT family acetyltransferase